ncbi:PDZ domain-containing protein [bacterium]|nr:PDZ domain-containing protein [bacterium]
MNYRIVMCAGLLLAGLASEGRASMNKPSIEYTLRMPAPHTHYFEVTMTMQGIKKDYIDIIMPVWTPGSYKVREFSRNVENVRATSGSQSLRVEKISKNTWRVFSGKTENVAVNYAVYAYELSVRTSFMDASHGYVNGASVFMYADGYQNLTHTVTIELYKEWKHISTGLKPVSGSTHRFVADHYDVLVDSPIEMGNHKILNFELQGVPHEIAIYGIGNYDTEAMLRDMRKIAETTAAMFGKLPFERYVFIIHCVPGYGGGLEHANSTTLGMDSWSFADAAGYNSFMSLTAHEYFHLWNVKRIRPKELGPFDYTSENYTKLLWIAEGFTAYYDDLITRRAGYYTVDQYLRRIEGNIQEVQSAPGRFVRSVEEASWDAWIKYYMPDENSVNSSISYYTKGALLGLMLDMEILRATRGEKSLDDLLRWLWTEYDQKLGRGFTPEEFQKAAERLAGTSLDMFFQNYVRGTAELDYNAALQTVGLRVKEIKSDAPYYGFETRNNGEFTIRTVVRDAPAWHAGLNVNDEVLAVDGIRVTARTLQARLNEKKIGTSVRILIARDTQLQEIVITPSEMPARYRLERVSEPTAQQEQIFKKWLNLN